MKIINGIDAKKVIEETLDIATSSVNHTLGPLGTNVVAVLDGKTTVTNDGVSIIKTLKLDKAHNIPLDIIKQACFNAERKSGDGTTTALILTKAIYDKIRIYESKYKALVLRNKLLTLSKELEELIIENSKKISTRKDILGVATVASGGDSSLGELITKAFETVKLKGTVDYKLEPTIENIKIESNNGYFIPCDYLGFSKLKEVKEAKVLIYSGTISTMQDLRELIIYSRNENDNKPIILFSNFEQGAIEGIFQYNSAGTNIYPFSLPSYGFNRVQFLKEISSLCNTVEIKNTFNFLEYDSDDFKDVIGTINSAVLKENGIIFNNLDKELYDKFIKVLEEKNPERAEELKNGTVTILVGGKTEVEADEKLLRIEDAVNSVKLAIESGIVISGASLFKKIALKIYKNYDNIENAIMVSALGKPFENLLINSTLKETEFKEIEKELLSSEKEFGFNVQTGKIENLFESGIIDATKTVINSLNSAISIATSLATINCIIYED